MIAPIFSDRCTGCNDCVAACPTHVLDPGTDGVPVIARPEQCQTCFMCELYCPVDAIYVAPEQRPEPVDLAAILASGQLGRLRHDYGWDGQNRDPLAEFWRLGPLLLEGAQTSAARYARQQEEKSKR
jgi:NAD-dependent dihydropyrimidine dehydrogenase PreA subunit